LVNIYCIDTSSIIDMEQYYPIRRVQRYWQLLDGLVNQRRLIAPVEVFKELTKVGDPYRWAYNHRRNNRLFISNFIGKYQQVQRIISECKGLIDPNKPSSIQADPYLIALVQYMSSRPRQRTLTLSDSSPDYIILTEEQATGNIEKYKIPDACRKYGILWYSMRKLLDLENWLLTP
jgi:hypothetical protein